ncbi:UDP-2,4-diacetamido-2,4,6-trideoxy-beta-L-altropyranose hydrolase [Halopseudomonas pelagia]|uniref:UDP-2,4-diacetamido-2,4, 6-trideoxy-beta-L-altropyranose hydrolase n=1 Tax=Halopseudomonas pelagia TaxID=553151 RepID=UPI0030D8E56B|tara:strand:+ start:25580 stop:26668 length:1089 start_codon:yes stop_codon:yes gene_type:complete
MNNRVVVFRVDASLEMGTGHLMRCLTLANALQAQGRECHFICREHPGNLIDYLRQQGHKVYPLTYVRGGQPDDSPAHAPWLGGTQAQDAAFCTNILADLQPEWLVVDHYALDTRWEQQLKPYYHRLLVIDDLADRPHQCDVLLDQTLGRDPQDYQPWVPADCTVLCGAHYALLRPEFAALRPYSLQRRELAPLRHILVSMGGVDKENATGQILAALATAELPAGSLITAVMGATSPWLEVIQQQAARLSVPTLVRSGVSDMAQLMADSDLAIGAAGATSWERCCLGLPSIMVVLAVNQQQVAEGLQAVHAVKVLAGPQDIPEELPTLAGELLFQPHRVHHMSKAAAGVTDGMGTARLLGYLE